MTPRATDAQVNQGQQIFRFDTFGDEQLWTDTLRMHEVIQSSVSPVTALSVGLTVDATALPANFLATRDLNSPAVLEMGGQGSFSDPRLGISITQEPDLVTPKLPALLNYQLSLSAPPPPPGSFDRMAARRGQALFMGRARCSSCHIPPTFTDVLAGPDPNIPLLHDPAEVGMDPSYAQRSATKKYRTTSLRGVWQHPPYFHDGSAPTLDAVVNHYDSLFGIGLTNRQKADLVEYLKSL